MKKTKINVKKIISILAAAMLTTGPALANAESNTSNTGFTLVRQEMKVEGNDLDINKYSENLEEGYNYLKGFNGPEFEDYDTLLTDLELVYYVACSPYMSSDTKDKLIKERIVFGEEYVKENFKRSFGLIDRINEYNARVIKEDYENKTMDIKHLINPGFLCFDPHDREIIESMFNNYYEAYKNGLFDTAEYVEVFKELTTLNSEEKRNNAFNSESGAMWIEQMTVGRQTIKMLYDDLLIHYTIDELSEYYVREKLENGIFELRDDTPSFDFECLNDLENRIFNIGELETFCYALVNNNMYKLFNITENSEYGNKLENYSDDIEDDTKDNKEDLKAKSEATSEDYTFTECVQKGIEYLSGKLSYDHLETQLNCAVYLANREYLTPEEESDLIKKGTIFKTVLFTDEGMLNFAHGYQIINNILDYNQSVIRRDYEEGTMDINHLIDPSFLCMNKNDREVVHNLHVGYFNAYQAGRYDNEYFRELKKLAGKKILSVGPMFVIDNIVYGDVMQMLRDDMSVDFKPQQRDKWLDNQQLKAGQWIVRDDVEPKEDSKDELEREIHDFKDLFKVVYTDVNDDMFASFDVNCNTK